jgi:hypothetical protein
MNPLTNDLAQAHITELRRRACRARLFGVDRPTRRERHTARLFRHQ